MPWAESVQIETAEQIDFDLEVAGPGSRFVAQLVDWVFKWLMLGGVALVGLILTGILAGDLDDLTRSTRYFLIAALGIVAFIIFFGYDVYYEGYCNGQTPGKRRSGIRVVRDSGGPIDATAAAVRNLIGLADFLPGFYVLGALVMMLSGRAQRLGDLAAGTLVIRERRDEAPDDIEEQINETASGDYHFQAEELDRCEANDLHILHSFFARYSIMEREQRGALAEKLCEIFLKKTGNQPALPIEHRSDRLAFLASLYRDMKALRKHR